MKVLVVNSSYDNGGAARAARRILSSVKQHGVECQMLVKDMPQGHLPMGEQVLALSEFRPHSKCFHWLDWCATKVKNKWQHHTWNRYPQYDKNCYLSDLRSTCTHGALRQLQYDVLHLHWINGRFLNINELTKVNKPIVWTLHDSWPFCGVCHYFLDCDKYKTHCGSCRMLWQGSSEAKEQDLSYQIFERKLKVFSKLDLHIVTPSNWLGNCAKSSAILGKFPVTVIPNSIDYQLFAPGSKAEAMQRWLPDEQGDKIHILYGAMNATTDYIKGFAKLLEAMKIFQTQYEHSNIELVVFGVTEAIPDLQLDFPVRYIGVVRNDVDMVKLYNLADVLVSPSLTENLSNVIMESLSCGTPVVAFNIGGNADMVDHQQNGFLAETEEQMAEGIDWCIRHNHDGHLSANARQKVLDNFTPERVGRLYTELYQQIAGGR